MIKWDDAHPTWKSGPHLAKGAEIRHFLSLSAVVETRRAVFKWDAFQHRPSIDELHGRVARRGIQPTFGGTSNDPAETIFCAEQHLDRVLPGLIRWPDPSPVMHKRVRIVEPSFHCRNKRPVRSIAGAGAAGARYNGTVFSVTNSATIVVGGGTPATTVAGATASVGGLTYDGTHPNSAGHLLMKAGIDTSRLVAA
jgi:hypothetical protein